MRSVLVFESNHLTYDQRVQKIAKTLTDHNWEVEVIYASKLSSDRPPDVSFHYTALNMWFKSGFAFYLELNIRLFCLGLFRRVQLISAVDVDTLPAAAMLKWLRGVPLILDCHEWYEESPEIIHRRNIYRFWKRMAKWLVPKADRQYTVNDSIGKAMQERYGVRFETIYNWPFKSNHAFDEKPGQEPIILYQGVLNTGRGLEELIHVAVRLPKLIVWLVGEGDLSKELKKMINDSGVSDRVIYFGRKTPEELKTITPQAWLGYNVLSKKSKSYYYSLANKTFDYLQAGIPALHMNFPEYSKLIENTSIGILVENSNVGQLSEAIEVLLNDPKKYSELKANCIDHANEFVWENQAEKLINIYKSVL